MKYEIRKTQSLSLEEIGCCEIFDRVDGAIVARLMRDNYTAPQFAWQQRDSGEILIWASTYECGYEIIHFGNRWIVHVDETDGHDFLWTDCKLSPDENRLAIGGCHWACPYEIRILDVSSDPPAFPLRVLASFSIAEGAISWIDNDTLCCMKEDQVLSRHSLGHYESLKTIRKWQAWEDKEGGVTFIPIERVAPNRASGILGDSAVLRHEVNATTGEHAMAQHYMLMGWEPYKPQGERIACPNQCGADYYPLGYGDCPNCGHIG